MELIENEFNEKWERANEDIDKIVNESLSVNISEMRLDFVAQVVGESSRRERYVAQIFGGLNGKGNWNSYLIDISQFMGLLKKRFKRVYLLDLKNDCPDDVFTLRVCFGE